MNISLTRAFVVDKFFDSDRHSATLSHQHIGYLGVLLIACRPSHYTPRDALKIAIAKVSLSSLLSVQSPAFSQVSDENFPKTASLWRIIYILPI